MSRFFRVLEEQRWDDHRFYHHSRINQSLHLLSALSFLASYVLVFTEPVAAALVGWLVAMVLRQVGHFFFEPKGYDEANRATHEYKEKVKVGYNLRRKVVLLSIWAASPVVLYLDPALLGLITPPTNLAGFVANVSKLWLALGALALFFRTVQLFLVRDVMTGLAWFAKILTDPFHDIKLYYKAPLYVVRGEWFDPIVTRQHA